MRLPDKRTHGTNFTLEIEKTKVLLVEGKDEAYFFEKLFSELDLDNFIQIIEMGGVEQMSDKLATLMLMPNFESIQSIGIIRDADQSFESALQSLKKILENNGLSVPPTHNSFDQAQNKAKVGVFIMPGEEVEGTMLEDLCLKTIEDMPYLSLIENYLDQLRESDLPMPSNIAKARTQIYLASQRKIVHSLGLGAQRGYWNFSHQNLEDIKDFLRNL